MDFGFYSDKIEEKFLKSEYISIAQSSFKMLFSPKKSFKKDVRIFCFIINGRDADRKLCQKLSQYSLSAAFYDSKAANFKTVVLPVFVMQEQREKTLLFIKQKAFKESGAFVLPSAFDLSEDRLYCCETFPLLSSCLFKEISQYAKKLLKP